MLLQVDAIRPNSSSFVNRISAVPSGYSRFDPNRSICICNVKSISSVKIANPDQTLTSKCRLRRKPGVVEKLAKYVGVRRLDKMAIEARLLRAPTVFRLRQSGDRYLHNTLRSR